MEPEASSWWDWQAAVAIAMFLAVVVALFGDWIRARLFKPKLQLTLEKPRGVVADVGITSRDPEEGGVKVRKEAARYYHLRVSNVRRWPPATQVGVHLLRIDQLGPDGEFRPTWNGEIPLLWQHSEVMPAFRTIGPAVNCALCSVVRGKWVGLHPLVMPQPFVDQYRAPANLRLQLQARSIERDSDHILIEIAWDGEWEDGEAEMARHMVVSVVSGN